MKAAIIIGTAVLLMATSALAQSSGPGGGSSAFGGGLTGGFRSGGSFIAPQPTAADRARTKRFLAKFWREHPEYRPGARYR